jgi:site-specific recombinase XerD
MAKLGNSRPGEVYTPEEISKLIKSCGNRYPTGIRNAGLIAVLYGAGLRINEALDLVLSDLDLEQGLIRVKHGKGDKYRTCSISPDCQAVLQTWLERRKAMGFNGREPVFCGITKGNKFKAWGTRLKDAYVRAMLPRLGKKAGIEKRIHAHGFRHSLATELAKENQDLRTISAQLGHSSVAVTDRYIQRIAPTELVVAMRSKNRLG